MSFHSQFLFNVCLIVNISFLLAHDSHSHGHGLNQRKNIVNDNDTNDVEMSLAKSQRNHAETEIGNETHINADRNIFIEILFERYSSKMDKLDLKHFRRLLQSIGLERIVKNDSDSLHISLHKHSNQLKTGSVTDNFEASINIQSDMVSETSLSENPKLPQDETKYKQCLSPGEILSLLNITKTDRLEEQDFLRICPALLDQLDGSYCNGGHQGDLSSVQANDRPSLWQAAGCSFLSVTVISLCSLAGAIFIPSRKREMYNHVLQFLVALAVGCLLSDAMLHLLPHALMESSTDHSGHDHKDHSDHDHTDHHHDHTDHHDHHDQVKKHDEHNNHTNHLEGFYKGLVGLMGIYIFFFVERSFTLFTSARKKHKGNKRKSKRNSRKIGVESGTAPMVLSDSHSSRINEPSCEDMVMVVHPNKALKAFADTSHEFCLHMCDESRASPVEGDGHHINQQINHNIKLEKVDSEIIGVQMKPESPIPSDSHHSHSHMAGSSLSSVASMILFGDMVHNLCDGLAIGTAFSTSLAGGISTSIAVFCHEFPHEIGDFAVLRRSGMSVKRAACLNLLSALPCYVSALFSLLAGNYGYLTPWIFACVAGMFLYIALAVLIPEMTAVYTKCGEPWYLHLLLQASGIAVGTTILIILSAVEEDLLHSVEH